MRLAVIADTHGNMEAFRSVLADIDARPSTGSSLWGTISDTVPNPSR